MSTSLTVSPSGTASLAAMTADIAKGAKKAVVHDDGSIESPVIDASATDAGQKPQFIRPFTPESLLDTDLGKTGRFLDVTA